MLQWVKKHQTVLITALVCLGFVIYCYGCEPKVSSLTQPNRFIGRLELQLELDELISRAQLKMADLEQQEQLRTIILQNALVLVQGQPFNPLGIISAVAAVYGISQGGSNITKLVKSKKRKGKVNNG